MLVGERMALLVHLERLCALLGGRAGGGEKRVAAPHAMFDVGAACGC